MSRIAWVWIVWGGLMGGTLSAQESGSAERAPKRGVIVPEDPFPNEPQAPEEPTGVENPTPLPPPVRSPLPGEANSPENPNPPDPSPPVLAPPTERAQSSDLIPAVGILLGGLFILAFVLFRMGLLNPFTRAIWPKQLELCVELALRMDDFMAAFREGNFQKCQMALDALNHLNGRRSILLSNEINTSVNQFLKQAVHVKISREDEPFQKNFDRQYEIAIEALRGGTRQDELSLEVLRSLANSHGTFRRLREE